jgi:hypothetical protein
MLKKLALSPENITKKRPGAEISAKVSTESEIFFLKFS